jgi:hypothetical protein
MDLQGRWPALRDVADRSAAGPESLSAAHSLQPVSSQRINRRKQDTHTRIQHKRLIRLRIE